MSQALVSDQLKLSILCVKGASLAFSLNDITVKYFTDSLPLHEVTLFRSLFEMAFILFLFGRGVPLKNHIFNPPSVAPYLARSKRGGGKFCFFCRLGCLAVGGGLCAFFIAPLLITGFLAFFWENM